MRFTVYDFSDYFAVLDLQSDDYEHEVHVDVYGCFDEDEEEWDDEKIRQLAEQQVRDEYGPMAYIEW